MKVGEIIMNDINEKISMYLEICKSPEYDESIKKIAKNEIITMCTPVICGVAKNIKFTCESFTIEDLYQEGVIILLRAIDNYNTDNNTNFTTYLTIALKNSLRRMILKKDRFIRLPENIVHNLPEYKNKKSDKYDATIDILSNEITLNTELDNENYTSVSPEDAYIKDTNTNYLKEKLNNLTNDEKKIICMRFYSAATYEEIGKVYNISSVAAYKRCVKILKKLNANITKDGFSLSDLMP